ncbi:MAG: hypothetical protein NT038_10670 [Euryarchaeota archaeon]|nr:hypothetical protein [Euryarchaeota archaeon]
MKINSLDRLIGTYCKIVMKEPGDEKARVVSGILREIDHDSQFVIVESRDGFGCLNIDAIVAIKPKH